MKDALALALASGGSMIVGGFVTAGFNWLTERTKARASAPATVAGAQAAFANALTQQAEFFIKALQDDRSHLENRVEELQQTVDQLKEEASALRAEHHTCLGENRQLNQRIDSLEAQLRRQGVPLPPAAKVSGFIELRDGKATVLQPTHDKPRRRRARKKETSP